MHPPMRLDAKITEISMCIFFINRAAALRSGGGPVQSPGAGAGAAGAGEGACSLPAPDHFSTTQKIAGTMRMSTLLAASMPPITVVPMIWRATEPGGMLAASSVDIL